jgi:hypothetical protein
LESVITQAFALWFSDVVGQANRNGVDAEAKDDARQVHDVCRPDAAASLASIDNDANDAEV